MARQGADLKGVASFHGSLVLSSPPGRGKLRQNLMVLHGADDKFIKPEQIEDFKKEMSSARVDYQFISYPGAMHSFTSSEADVLTKKFNMPIAYDRKRQMNNLGKD